MKAKFNIVLTLLVLAAMIILFLVIPMMILKR
jgi:hypothetical protein